MSKSWGCLLLVLLPALAAVAGEPSIPEREAFEMGSLAVPAGEAGGILLPVDVEEADPCFIPVTVIHGARPGPVLALVAGVHGYEYPPILALYRLKESIDPACLSGTLILVHIANLPGFQRRTIYYNPYDWKNLNRVFPGNPEGSQAERIADVLVEKIVRRCDALIDMHCGDGNEALIPYCYWMVSGDRALDERSREMVLAFGIRHIIIDDSRTKDLSQSKYLGNTAVLLGKPAITTESGFLGRTDEEDVARNIRGALGVIRHLKMLPGEVDGVDDPVWIDKYEVVYAEESGLFHPLTPMGYFVKAGQRVGYVTDYLGNVRREYSAPFTGMMLYIVSTPPANRGEPLFEVGRIKQD